MKTILVFFILIISLDNFIAQKIETTYYNKDWKPVSTKDSAEFYGTKQKINDSTVLIKDYFLTDTLQNKGQYINGVKKGRWTYYRADGTIKTDFEFINDGKNKNWFTFDEDQLKPNNEGIYHTVNNHSEFMETTKTPNEYINSNFVLPKKALKNGFTSFEVTYKIIIDEKGKVVNAYEMRSKGYRDKNGEYKTIEEESKLKYDVDKALSDFLLNMPNWKPAIVRKQPVKSAHNIYIKFKK
jgi:antitoxin component YwqK of YwqJK toxin-antitoxin module